MFDFSPNEIFEHHMMRVVQLHTCQTRKWNRSSPYSIHPLWCATTLLCEEDLDEYDRYNGALALLYHDVIEEVKDADLSHLTPAIMFLIKGMTFRGGFAEEQKELWGRSPLVIMLKLYDKVSNLLDGHWMKDEKRSKYHTHTWRILEFVRENYGNLMICDIAEAVLRR